MSAAGEAGRPGRAASDADTDLEDLQQPGAQHCASLALFDLGVEVWNLKNISMFQFLIDFCSGLSSWRSDSQIVSFG